MPRQIATLGFATAALMPLFALVAPLLISQLVSEQPHPLAGITGYLLAGLGFLLFIAFAMPFILLAMFFRAFGEWLLPDPTSLPARFLAALIPAFLMTRILILVVALLWLLDQEQEIPRSLFQLLPIALYMTSEFIESLILLTLAWVLRTHRGFIQRATWLAAGLYFLSSLGFPFITILNTLIVFLTVPIWVLVISWRLFSRKEHVTPA